MIECSFFGKGARLRHIGLAVKSIKEVCPACKPFAEQTQKVSLAFIDLNGVRVELVEPLGDSSPIAKNLRDGVRLLHLCYEVTDLEEAVEYSRAAGFHRLSQPVPAPIFDGRRIVWVFSKQYGLIELLERQRKQAAWEETTQAAAL